MDARPGRHAGGRLDKIALGALLDGIAVPPLPDRSIDVSGVRRGSVTRFAPAPTGALHLGHLVNALHVSGVARATSGHVLLRIEDHDRQRSRAEYEAELLDDLDRLGLAADEPSTAELRAGASAFRQSDASAAYEGALATLARLGLAYRCDCSRATFAEHLRRTGKPWLGPGCPGSCRERDLPDEDGLTVRVAVGDGTEAWQDVALGAMEAPVASGGGDLAIRDRNGNWTYTLCVVVDDLRHGVDLVIRGRDLVDATPPQIRLGRMLGRGQPPVFLHHPLVRTAAGAKLSKADGATSVRSLLEAGWSREALFGVAARLGGLRETIEPLALDELGGLFARFGP